MKLTINRTTLKNPSLKSNSGFIIADFLFSFVLVIGIGMIIFALTFSLATVEIAQYIVWSSARNYAAANTSESVAATQARLKFDNLSRQFPLLTGQGSATAPWFTLEFNNVGDLAKVDRDFMQKVSSSDAENLDGGGEKRQPWTGVSARINLKLFSSLRIPFLGKIAEDPDKFSFPIRAFVIRSPSSAECKSFFEYQNRFVKGIKNADSFSANMNASNMANPPSGESSAYVSSEDNGC